MFEISSDFKPAGDQPNAIKKLVEGLNRGDKFQTLLGVTGSRQNFYSCKYNRAGTETYSNFGAQ